MCGVSGISSLDLCGRLEPKIRTWEETVFCAGVDKNGGEFCGLTFVKHGMVHQKHTVLNAELAGHLHLSLQKPPSDPKLIILSQYLVRLHNYIVHLTIFQDGEGGCAVDTPYN